MLLASDRRVDRPAQSGAVVLRLAGAVDRAMGVVCQVVVLATIAMLLAMLTLNVAARYVFEQGGITWIGELPEQLFPWLIAAGIVLAARNGSHIAVDFALTQFGPRIGRVIALAVNLLIVVSYVVLFVVVLRVADIAGLEHSPLLGLSRSYGYFALAFGCAGTALASLIITLRIWCLGLEALPKGQVEDSPL